jgi:hypothetical protein
MRRLLLLLSILLVPLPLAGEAIHRGAVVGVVSDRDGTPVAGARVELEGGIIHRVTSSDAAGRFYFALVPPGRYSALAERDDRSTVIISELEVSAARTTEISFLLTEDDEVVTLAVETPLLDRGEIAARATITREELEPLPQPRDGRAMFLAAPGVALTRTLLIPQLALRGNLRGLPVGASAALLDGVEVGRIASLLDPRLMEEVSLLTASLDPSLSSGTSLSLATLQLGSPLRGSISASLGRELSVSDRARNGVVMVRGEGGGAIGGRSAFWGTLSRERFDGESAAPGLLDLAVLKAGYAVTPGTELTALMLRLDAGPEGRASVRTLSATQQLPGATMHGSIARVSDHLDGLPSDSGQRVRLQLETLLPFGQSISTLSAGLTGGDEPGDAGWLGATTLLGRATLRAAVRFDRRPDQVAASPRAAAAWTFGERRRVIVRGGAGRFTEERFPWRQFDELVVSTEAEILPEMTISLAQRRREAAGMELDTIDAVVTKRLSNRVMLRGWITWADGELFAAEPLPRWSGRAAGFVDLPWELTLAAVFHGRRPSDLREGAAFADVRIERHFGVGDAPGMALVAELLNLLGSGNANQLFDEESAVRFSVRFGN